VEAALNRLEAAGLAARISDDGQPQRWTAAEPEAGETALANLELHGPHDLRHTFATWLERGSNEQIGEDGRSHSICGGTRD
jgi:integrase